VSLSLGTFYPQTANGTEPNRTEPKFRFVRFIVVGSVYGFALFGVRLRLRVYSQTKPRNRTNRSAVPADRRLTRLTPSRGHALSPSRPIVRRPIKTQRKPPSGHPAAQRVERQRRSPQPLIPLSRTLTIPFPNPKSSSGGRRATGAGHGEPARRREAGGGRLRAQSQPRRDQGGGAAGGQAPGNTLVKFSDQDNGGADGAILQCKFRSSFNSSSGLLLFSLLLLIPNLKYFISRWGT